MNERKINKNMSPFHWCVVSRAGGEGKHDVTLMKASGEWEDMMSKSKYYMKKLSCLCAVSGLALAVAAASASAEEAKNYSIQEQSLSRALMELSRQSDTVITASPALVAGKSAAAVSGMLSTEQALSQLLADTGLSFQRGSDGGIIIVQAEAGAGDSEDADDAPTFVLEEIIVTATRRAASMQDVPVSISAYSGNKLKESGVNNVQDLQFLTAGLQVHTLSGKARIALRGVGSDIINVGAESGVAMHLDGVYIAQQHEVGLGFFDVERIEVLRGPQGTLYGRNATGGAVNVISKSPTQEFEAGASVTIGNYNHIETEGYISGPLAGDKLTARVVFKTREHDGYTLNIFDGDRLDEEGLSAARASLRYEPSPDFRVDVIADVARDHSMPSSVVTRVPGGDPLPFELGGGELPTGRAVNHNDEDVVRTDAWGLSAKLLWDTEDFTLSSLSAYRDSYRFMRQEVDGGNTSLTWVAGEHNNTWQFSQEMTIASAGDSDLEWIAGAYYFHGFVSQFGDVFVPLQVTYSADYFKTDAYAAFAEASYPVLDRLTLTLGGRYSYEKKAIAGALIIPLLDSVDFQALEDSWSAFSPKVALTYEINDDVSAYATVSKGFKAGGYNGGFGVAANPLGAYDPEKATNYEVGVKAGLLDGRVQANLSLFHMDYTELQVSARRIVPGADLEVTAVQNAASSRIRGAELEVQARLTEQFSVDINAAYLDAIFKNWPDAATLIGTSQDVSGFQLLNAPKWAINAGAAYTMPVGSWGYASLRGEYAYKSRVYFDPFENLDASQEAVGMLNGRLTLEDADGNWSIAAWVKNATNEFVASRRTVGITAEVVSATTLLLAPRTYGLTVSYNF